MSLSILLFAFLYETFVKLGNLSTRKDTKKYSCSKYQISLTGCYKRRSYMTEKEQLSTKNAFSEYYIQLHNVKVLKEAVENGTAPFLPNSNGVIDTNPIYNLNNGICVNDMNLLLLKCKQAEMGITSNVVGTHHTLQSLKTAPASKDKGLSYVWRDDDKKYHTARYYFPEDLKEPEKMQEKSFKVKFPQKLNNQTISVTKGSDYLPAYFAACESGLKLNVSKEVIEEFKKEFIAVAANNLEKKNDKEKEIKNMIPSLRSYCVNADITAKEIIKKAYGNENKAEQKQAPQKQIQHDRKKSYDQDITIF